MTSLARTSLLIIPVLVAMGRLGQAGEIHDAVSRSDLAAATSILDRDPALVNAKDEFMQLPPLLVAVQDGNREFIEFLLSRNADINAEGMGGYTALRWAVTLGKLDVAELLVDRGAHMDIYAAASFGDKVEVLRLLAQDPSLANPPQPLLRKPIHLAARGKGVTHWSASVKRQSSSWRKKFPLQLNDPSTSGFSHLHFL